MPERRRQQLPGNLHKVLNLSPCSFLSGEGDAQAPSHQTQSRKVHQLLPALFVRVLVLGLGAGAELGLGKVWELGLTWHPVRSLGHRGHAFSVLGSQGHSAQLLFRYGL